MSHHSLFRFHVLTLRRCTVGGVLFQVLAAFLIAALHSQAAERTPQSLTLAEIESKVVEIV